MPLQAVPLDRKSEERLPVASKTLRFPEGCEHRTLAVVSGGCLAGGVLIPCCASGRSSNAIIRAMNQTVEVLGLVQLKGQIDGRLRGELSDLVVYGAVHRSPSPV